MFVFFLKIIFFLGDQVLVYTSAQPLHTVFKACILFCVWCFCVLCFVFCFILYCKLIL